MFVCEITKPNQTQSDKTKKSKVRHTIVLTRSALLHYTALSCVQGQESYLCPSVTGYLMPLRAVNTAGKWRVVVNGVKAHYETLTQTVRLEECSEPGQPCPLVPACYSTQCLQKSIYHR